MGEGRTCYLCFSVHIHSKIMEGSARNMHMVTVVRQLEVGEKTVMSERVMGQGSTGRGSGAGSQHGLPT